MAMKAKYPQFKASFDKDRNIVFNGFLHVKPELPIYQIRIIYRYNMPPLVLIISPTLVEKAPHIYSNTNSLCLYHKNNFKWSSSKLIANEIMGWTAGWIYFYEFWLQSGDWVGPEVPHNI